VKRRILLKRLAALARTHRVDFCMVRSTGPHDIYRWGDHVIPVPRHREINERLAQAILRDVQQGEEEAP